MRKFFLTPTLAVLTGITCAQAQTYPSRPITLIVPAAVGGPTDTLARILTERMITSLGQAIIIENQGTAGGTVAVGQVARAAPDGYTIGIGHNGNHVFNSVIYSLPYDLLKDFEPIALLASNPQLIVTKNAIPAKDLKELIAWLKQNPDSAMEGTAGLGSPGQISGFYFQNITGTRFQFVPYRGMGPAMQDLLGGHIDLMFDQATNALPQVRAGRIRAYAVTANTRLEAAPDIPTVDEAGLPGFYVSVWHGLWAPKGTSREIIAKLNSAVVEALADPTVRQRFAELGQRIPSREQQTPEALRVYQNLEAEKWLPIIKAANIKAE